jgi:hypothetical protein
MRISQATQSPQFKEMDTTLFGFAQRRPEQATMLFWRGLDVSSV